MRKPLRIVLLSSFIIGIWIGYAHLVLPPILPDFMSGFVAGISTAFILVGLAYVGWCIGKKKNPFSFTSRAWRSWVRT